jgi:hypothetical protein
MAPKTTLETIWYIPDDLWDKIRPLLGREKQPGTGGRPTVPHRTCLDGILYVLRTGASGSTRRASSAVVRRSTAASKVGSGAESSSASGACS